MKCVRPEILSDMSDKDITFLSFVADALVQRPDKWGKIIGDAFGSRPSKNLFCTAILAKLSLAFSESGEDLKKVRRLLSESGGPWGERALEVLSWGQGA